MDFCKIVFLFYPINFSFKFYFNFYFKLFFKKFIDINFIKFKVPIYKEKKVICKAIKFKLY